jgi:hypothetical protein
VGSQKTTPLEELSKHTQLETCSRHLAGESCLAQTGFLLGDLYELVNVSIKGVSEGVHHLCAPRIWGFRPHRKRIVGFADSTV